MNQKIEGIGRLTYHHKFSWRESHCDTGDSRAAITSYHGFRDQRTLWVVQSDENLKTGKRNVNQ